MSLLLLGRRGLLGSQAGRQKCQRIDVPVRFRGVTNAEVHIRLRPLGLAARPDRADHVALAHLGPDRDPDRPEVDERDRPAVLGADRQAQTLMRHLTGICDDAARRGANVRARRSADVDPAVLSACVGIALGDERSEHGPVDGPRPGRCSWSKHDGGECYEENRVACLENHAARVQRRSAVVKFDYREAR